MALINEEKEIIRKVIQQGGRRIARLPVINMKRIILNPIAKPDLLHHLQIIVGAHLQPLNLQQFAPLFEKFQPSFQFQENSRGRAF